MATGVIGVMGALEEEVRLIASGVGISATESHLGRTFYRGRFAGHEVVVVRSGIGKVRAAACSQFLIDKFGVGQLVFAGIAGALRPGLSIGDIVVSERALEWDLRGVRVERRWYLADPVLVALAVKVAEQLGRRVSVGSVVTGDQPVFKPGHRQELREKFNGDCAEMEGGAVAHVCSMNQVPFVLVRAISDLADENALQDLTRSFAEVSSLPAEIVLAMIKELH